MILRDYNRTSAVQYAKNWALKRNPKYLNFDGIGGDCANFASQCLFAGGGIMNFTKDVGWYYNSPYDRAAAWSGAQFLNKFLLNNKSVGPVGKQADISEIQEGDLIQLNNGQRFYHTLVVTGTEEGVPLICCHTVDSYMRRLDSYHYVYAQGIHIVGFNSWS